MGELRRSEEERTDRGKDIRGERLNRSETFRERKNCNRGEFEMSVGIGVKYLESARIAIEENLKFEI